MTPFSSAPPLGASSAQGGSGTSWRSVRGWVVGSIACFSVLSILSYNVLDELRFAGRNFNDAMDLFSNQVLLPLGGLLIAIFAGWVMSVESTRDELTTLHAGGYALWRFLIRFVVPPAVLVIFIMGIADKL
mgnify:CR=1 FL=1